MQIAAQRDKACCHVGHRCEQLGVAGACSGQPGLHVQPSPGLLPPAHLAGRPRLSQQGLPMCI